MASRAQPTRAWAMYFVNMFTVIASVGLIGYVAVTVRKLITLDQLHDAATRREQEIAARARALPSPTSAKRAS